MTILIAGWLDFPPETARSMIEAADPLIRAALDEPGCRAYSWALDPTKAGRIHVFEEWASEADLQFHFDNAPYKQMGDHLRAGGMSDFSVKKYRSDLAEPVYDDQGVPRSDFFTA
ncbi:putative quinol monooxygenase [Sphingomonas profundi]|uniref:putative quinol monooxygenase n=1 Tax=Alterirhizorhabdus profundi TaxID=2681549 RepID=UPI0018D012F6|nr:antibiotic biosynthesis monooxygenase [Sphingomonas profundi]